MIQRNKHAAVVLEQQEIATDIFDLWLATPIADTAKPGHFVNLYPRDASTLLPRPISICEVDQEHKKIRLVYRIAGKGTAEFATYKKNENIQILGPLGNGFPIEAATGKSAFLIGGGIGIPPMLELAKALTGEKTVVLGYRDKELFLFDEMQSYAPAYAATEDGSVGTKGNVLTVLKEKNLHPDLIYACGPMPMLRAIKEYAKENEIPAYLSLEERMACGVGACLGCVCKTKNKDLHSHVHNARICTDGPVFEAEEVDI